MKTFTNSVLKRHISFQRGRTDRRAESQADPGAVGGRAQDPGEDQVQDGQNQGFTAESAGTELQGAWQSLSRSDNDMFSH